MQKSSSAAVEQLQHSLHAFAGIPLLIFEVKSVYKKFSPSALSMRGATRVCCAIALFQVMANNPETRTGLTKAEIPCYFYPFLKPYGDDKHLECVRTTTLGVLSDLTKFDDPNGSHALRFFLESEVVPLCLKCIDECDEKSQKLATLIVMNILTQESGLTYCSATPERFFAIVQHNHEASRMLQVLHLNSYGCPYFPPIEERKSIAKKAASSYASSSASS
uniref:Cell differentiation protein rcd1 n=1 Tax=Solanum lycopersicum TaxID=4081 RepID=K4CF78_SOLLC